MTNVTENQNGQTGSQLTVKSFFSREDIKQKFNELLGKRSSAFITSVLQIVSQNDMLKDADVQSIYHSAAVAATLDLPLNPNLGFAYIIPYNNKQRDGSYKVVAQFQMGYKGFIQLAQRSGQFKTIAATPIFEGQLIESNPLTGYKFDFTKKSDVLIGFASFFQLLNGFEKTFYMTIEELKKHGFKYSKTYSNPKTKPYSKWETDFEAMATKTVIKLLLSKYAPLSIEMQKAVVADQGLIQNEDASEVVYMDNEETITDPHLIAASKERERIKEHIVNSKNKKQLTEVASSLGADDELHSMYDEKLESFNTVNA